MLAHALATGVALRWTLHDRLLGLMLAMNKSILALQQ